MPFESQSDVFEAFEKHNKFVEIVNDNGEYEAVEKLSGSVFKYFINEDQILQIGDQLYKVFDNNFIVTDLCNYDDLINISEFDIPRINVNSDYEVHTYKILFTKKNTGHPVSYGYEDKSGEQNKRRVKLTVDLHWAAVSLWRKHRIAPQKKVFGIWWNYNAIIDAEIKWRYDFNIYGTWHTESEKYTYDGVNEDVILVERPIYFESSNTDDFHFRGFDCTATTSDLTVSADVEFNTSAIGSISPDDTYYFD